MKTKKLISGISIIVSILIWPFSINAQLGGFQCPLDGKPQIRQADSLAKEGGRFNSNRGSGRNHGALDLNSTLGKPVKASMGGYAAVAHSSWGAMGGTVIMDHGSGAYTVYGHLQKVLVKEGEKVKIGQKIGTVGYSGNASALKVEKLPPHLHFALIQAGQTGLADKNKPLRKMKEWGDYWKSLGADLTGAVNPGLFISNDCWKGSTTAGAPGES